MAKDATRYTAFYSPDFGPQGGDKAAWRAKWQADRQRALERPGAIDIQLGKLQSKVLSATRVETTFEQVYRSSTYRDTMTKTLTWELHGGNWLIVGESNR